MVKLAGLPLSKSLLGADLSKSGRKNCSPNPNVIGIPYNVFIKQKPTIKGVSQMASVSIKVPTAKVIALLQDKIATLETEIANYPQAKADYVQAKKDHEKSLIAIVISSLTNKPELIGTDYESPIRVQTNSYGRGVNVSVSFDADALGFPKAPIEPTNPNDTISVNREWVRPIDVLKNTLKTLMLTEQETINTSTYANVMKLL